MDSAELAVAFVHPYAWVEGSKIGARTKVWQFASVIRGADIGKDCTVGANAMVDGAVLGDGCIVGGGASVNPGFKAGKGVFIGPNAVICNDLWPNATKDGFELGGLLDHNACTVIAEDGAAIGAGAVILPGVRLGKGSLVAAGATCGRYVPDRHFLDRRGCVFPIPKDAEARRMVLIA